MCSRFILTLFVIGSLVVAACATPAGPAATPTASATTGLRSAILSELRNAVEAQVVGGANWQSAIEGQTIVAGGAAKTGAESRVRIDITDGSLLRIAPNSLFELRELSPEVSDPLTKLYLTAGKVFAQVTQAPGGGSFEIETPVGSATVRGSLMSVTYDPATGQMTVTCLEGHCRITGSSGAFVDLNAGEQSRIQGAGQDPTPAQLMEDSQLTEWGQEFPEARSALATVTASPRATATPSFTPTPTLTAIPAAQSACDHPYLPLRPGASWTYVVSGGEDPRPRTVTVSAVEGDTQRAVAETNEYVYECDANGIVLVGSQFNRGVVTNLSGVYLPPADVLTVGRSWQYVYATVYAVSPGATLTITTSATHTIVGSGSVELNGQTYPGLQLSVESVIEVTGVLGNRGRSEYTFTRVLARNVGVVEEGNRRLVEIFIP